MYRKAFLALALAGCLPSESVATEKLTKLLKPVNLASANHGASCYYQSRFVGNFSEPETVTVEIIRSADVPDFLERDLSNKAVFFEDVVASGKTMDEAFETGFTVMIGQTVFAANDATSSGITAQYSGQTYAEYTTSSEDKYYPFFMDGKWKYHESVNAKVLACVFPEAWKSTDGYLSNGTVLSITVETTDFEFYAWNSVIYRTVFQFGFALAFMILWAECLYGLVSYGRYCTFDEMNKLFRSPLITLFVNACTSFGMGIILFLDGWQTTGFLTVETFSAFVTLTLMTTMGTVITMAIHWMSLRQMVVTVHSRLNSIEARNGLIATKGAIKRMRRWLKVLAGICLFADFFSFIYVKVFREVLETIWIPLLISISILEVFIAVFFTQQSSLFAKEVRELVKAKNLASAENLKFLHKMMYYMRLCTVFLIMSVLCSISLGLLPFKQNVFLWCILWGVAMVARIGIAHTIVRSSFLNVAGRKKASNQVRPNGT